MQFLIFPFSHWFQCGDSDIQKPQVPSMGSRWPDQHSVSYQWFKFKHFIADIMRVWQQTCRLQKTFSSDKPTVGSCSLVHLLLTHWGLVIQTQQFLVNIGSGNGLLLNGTKPLPDPMLISHHISQHPNDNGPINSCPLCHLTKILNV